MCSFPDLETVYCSMPSSNYCFLTCIQISQEAGQVVWDSHLLKNFPQFVVIHTVKGFGVVNKTETNVFLELSCFFHDPIDGNLIPGSSAFSKTSLNTPDQIANILWIIERAREFQKNIYICFIEYAKAFDCVDHNKLENSSRDGTTRLPDLLLEKSACRSRSNS